LVFELGAQSIRIEIPDAYFAIRRTSNDCTRASRSDGCVRAISTADDVYKDDSLHALAVGVATQGWDDLALA
jgi:hypothetical protein